MQWVIIAYARNMQCLCNDHATAAMVSQAEEQQLCSSAAMHLAAALLQLEADILLVRLLQKGTCPHDQSHGPVRDTDNTFQLS